jgi:type I restriction-modification system DNA methylase subunit
VNDKVLFVNASELETFKAGPKQVLTDKTVKEICDIVNLRKEINEVSKLIDLKEIAKNDYSLSVNKYVIKKTVYQNIDIKSLQDSFVTMKNELDKE